MWEKGHILLIEEDEAVGESICDELETTGYRTFHCGTCDEASVELEQRRFDVMIISVHVLDEKGADAISCVKEKAEGLPVIVITEITAQELNKQALKSGADCLLYKPFTFNQLLSEIKRAMTKGIVDQA